MITSTKRLKASTIYVVLYLRMSSDKQDTSIDDQRAELLAYCAKHGYTIVREYMDEGISGWKSRQRKGFTHLIADATLGEFQVVVCWDQGRFSRFEPMEANFYWHQLKVAGVRIETIKEGRLDLDSLGGWLSASVAQHGKAEYVRSLAVDVARGQRAKRAKGLWLGKATYGYRVGPDQTLIMGPDNEVATVRRIFALRLQGYGCRRIAATLNNEGLPAPHAKLWHNNSIRAMLRVRTYVGDSVCGAFSRPRFAGKAEVKVIQNTHPAIISRTDFAMAQMQKFDRGGRRAKKDSEGAPLAGLIVCGRCGSPMYNNNNQTGRYVCGLYVARGQCTHNTIERDVALQIVASVVREHVLYGTLERLTEVIEEELSKRVVAPKVDAPALRKQIAALDQKLDAAAERLVTVDRSLVPTVEAKMLELKRQRDALEDQLKVEPKPKKKASAKAIAADFWKLDETLRKGKPTTVRHALRQLIEKFEIRYEGFPTKGKRVNYKPVSATIHFSLAHMPSKRPWQRLRCPL